MARQALSRMARTRVASNDGAPAPQNSAGRRLSRLRPRRAMTAVLGALFSVSCTSASYCSAVGASSTSANGAVSPLAETWNGTSWSLQTAAG